MAEQRTLRRAVRFEGIGLHTGRPARVEVRPAAEGTGLRFFKAGRPVGAGIDPASARCTAVGSGEGLIRTVEHLTAALSGLGIDNAEIDVHGDEVPGMDGSALPFVQALLQAGHAGQGLEAEEYAVREPILCHHGSSAVGIFPAGTFSAAYVLDYPAASLGPQTVDFEDVRVRFAEAIAPARTFCTEEEAARVKAAGLGLGADTGNTLVMTARGPVENTLRFPDECARHKVLDLIGDLALLGFRVRGKVIGIRSGHTLNHRLSEAIQKQRAS